MSDEDSPAAPEPQVGEVDALDHVPTDTGFNVYVGVCGDVWVLDENGESVGPGADFLSSREFSRIKTARLKRVSGEAVEQAREVIEELVAGGEPEEIELTDEDSDEPEEVVRV